MNRRLIVTTLIVGIAALGIGYLLGRSTHRPMNAAPARDESTVGLQQVYTCSMHPQIRLNQPGKCPICEMPLILATAAQTGSEGEPMLQLSDHALAMAGVETTPVIRREVSRKLRAVGAIQFNETSLATVTARVDGYTERLFVNFTGIEIKAGDHLAEIYSPELLVAQQELLIALGGGADKELSPLMETAKIKIRRWGLTEAQITALIEQKSIADRVTLYSPISGTVIERSVVQNSAFKAGDALYKIANLDTVWVYLDIYEYDLAWIRYGQSVELSAEALPGRAFTGMVTFVQPVLNEETRSVRVPVHVENRDHALKPGMFVSALVHAALDRDGRAAPTGVEGKFSCPMHPQVLVEAPGPCPNCGMPLEQIPGDVAARDLAAQGRETAANLASAASPAYACPMKCEGETTYGSPGNCPVCNMKLKLIASEPGPTSSTAPGLLVVPLTAVLDSGTRRIVYVKRSRGLFEPREVVVGPRAGEFVPILDGVGEGEHVVTRGGFLIDSQFQITGHPSLFYPGGLSAGAGGHQHGGTPAAGEAPVPMPLKSPAPESGGPEKHNH